MSSGPVEQPPLPPLPPDPAVSVVIPARDAAATLPTAVRSVLAQVPPPAEVVIAVGPSRDGTRAAAERFATDHPDRVRVVDNPTGGTPEALNVAIAASTGQVVARVDAHAELPAGYLATAVEALRRTGAGNVGGRQVPTADHGFARAVAAAMRSPFGAGGASYRTGTVAGPVDTVYLGVFRREALDAVGGFDPAFVRNQDAELNLRLARAGYPVWFEPALAVAYQPRGTVRGLASQYLQYGRWRRRTARTHRRSLRPRQLAAPIVVVALAASAVASAAVGSWVPAAVVVGGYGVGVLAAGLLAADDGLPGAPATALALATMHLSWGVGFLLGPPRERDGEAA